MQKPTLVLAHNKTLAGQLYSEFKEFFPENNVEYFVSFYDYYQPEAYVPSSDTYIEKDASINDEIDKLRLAATAALVESRDTIVVASVSCLYGLGDPEDYENLIISLKANMTQDRNKLLKKLITMQYTRNEIDFKRGTFRAKGDVVEIFPADEGEKALRVNFWGDEIDKIEEINPLTGKKIRDLKSVLVVPNSHYVTTKEKMDRVLSCVYNHRSSKNATNIEDLCVADADIIAHFDNIPMLFNSAYNRNNINLNEVRNWLKESFEKDYNDLSDKTKESYKEQYNLICKIVIGEDI